MNIVHTKSSQYQHANASTIINAVNHFTVLCSVTRPLNESEAGVDLALIQTQLLFLCKSYCCNYDEFLFSKEKQ